MKVVNRRARHEYVIEDTLEAGITLTGSEVKSVKLGRIDLSEAYVRLREREAWLLNAYIPPYLPSGDRQYDPRRSRKLLLHKRQLIHLLGRTARKNLTLIPLSCYTTRNLVKIEVGLGRGKRQFEKKQTLRRRDIERQLEEELRGKI